MKQTSQAPTVSLPPPQARSTGQIQLATPFLDDLGSAVESGAGNMAAQDALSQAPPDDDGGGVLTQLMGSEPDASESETATRQLDDAGGGTGLPDDVRGPLEAALGEDLSGVRLHEGDSAVADIGARAAALGDHIFFGPGEFDPSSAEGMEVIAEEVIHTVQSGPASGPAAVGESDSAAESEAKAVAAQVTSGKEAGPVGSHEGSTIRRAEAPTHTEITAVGHGVANPEMGRPDNPNQAGNDAGQLGGFEHRDSENLSPEQRRMLEVYAGNFMSDFSQANVPVAAGIVGNHLTTVRGGQRVAIGTEGGAEILQGVIHAMAILELGTEAAELVNAATTEVYMTARHIDHSMGITNDDLLVRDGGLATGNAVHAGGDPSQSTRCIATTNLTEEESAQARAEAASTGQMQPTSPEAAQRIEAAQQTNATHSGAATGELTVENRRDWEVSPAGLSNHIYNSIELAKNDYGEAAQRGDSPLGRMALGRGDHIVQDYYFHSNFIEVGLNRYINDALATRSGDASVPGADSYEDRANEPDTEHNMRELSPEEREHNREEFLGLVGSLPSAEDNDTVEPQFVHPTFDASSYDEEGNERQAITTGTFGTQDTIISLAHVFLPHLPALADSLRTSIDQFFGLVMEAPEGASATSLLEAMESRGRQGAALQAILGAMNDAGVTVPAPTGLELTWTEASASIGIGPFTIDTPSVRVPDGLTAEWTDTPVFEGINTFLSAHVTVRELKNRAGEFAEAIGIGAVRRIIDEAWNGIVQRWRNELKAALLRLQWELMALIASRISGEEITADEMARQAGGSMNVAVEQAEHMLHGEERSTSTEMRLAEGGDLHDETVARDRTEGMSEAERDAFIEEQRIQLERTVGPVTGSGTEEDPWVPVTPLPPSHSEVSKDHPPHDPAHHAPHEHHPDANPELLNVDPHADPMGIEAQRAERRHHHDEEHEHDHDDDERTGHTLAEDAAVAHDHGMEDGNEDGHGDEHGSSFHALAVLLAFEAQRHIAHQVEQVWGAAPDAGEDYAVMSQAASARRDEAMRVSHESMMEQASSHADLESQRAAGQTGVRIPDPDSGQPLTLADITSAHCPRTVEENGTERVQTTHLRWRELLSANPGLPTGVDQDTDLRAVYAGQTLRFPQGWIYRTGMHHRQSETGGSGEAQDALRALYDLVDLFVSHPEDSTWWRGIMDSYVTANPREVYNHILRRNEGMAGRTAASGYNAVAGD